MRILLVCRRRNESSPHGLERLGRNGHGPGWDNPDDFVGINRLLRHGDIEPAKTDEKAA
jgi:hypothetical protein